MPSTSTIGNYRDYAFNENGRPITYVTTASQSMDGKTLAVTRTTVSVTIEKALYSSKGDNESASMVVRVRTAELPYFPPRKQDVIRIGSLNYQILRWTGSQTDYVCDIEITRA